MRVCAHMRVCVCAYNIATEEVFQKKKNNNIFLKNQKYLVKSTIKTNIIRYYLESYSIAVKNYD